MAAGKLEARLDKLNRDIAKAQTEYKAKIVELVGAALAEYGLGIGDLISTPVKAPAKKKVRKIVQAVKKPARKIGKQTKRGPQPAKYRNPETGQEWSGFARPPRWIADAPDRSVFLIQ